MTGRFKLNELPPGAAPAGQFRFATFPALIAIAATPAAAAPKNPNAHPAMPLPSPSAFAFPPPFFSRSAVPRGPSPRSRFASAFLRALSALAFAFDSGAGAGGSIPGAVAFASATGFVAGAVALPVVGAVAAGAAIVAAAGAGCSAFTAAGPSIFSPPFCARARSLSRPALAAAVSRASFMILPC